MLRTHIHVPLDPVYEGPNQAALADTVKARVAQLIGFRSITATAELPVTFGQCSLLVGSAPFGLVGLKSCGGDGASGRPRPTKGDTTSGGRREGQAPPLRHNGNGAGFV